MEDLIQPQIQDSCRLAVPEGLKDLMSDISREVLRAQPKNLLQFITDYLSALLVTRENLTAANRICQNICENMCAADLEDELRYRGIEDEDASIVKELVEKHLKNVTSGVPTKEINLMSKILKKTSISPEMIYNVQEAVLRAFVRHQAYNTTIYEMTPDDSMDDVTRAAHHTLDLYRRTRPTDDEFHRAAEKIDAAYRAYGVRRQKETEMERAERFYSPEMIERAAVEDTNEMDQSNTCDEHKARHISFSEEYNYDADTESRNTEAASTATNVTEKTDGIDMHSTKGMATVSSYSLAGSHIHLPLHKPYCAHNEPSLQESEEESDETVEKQCKDHFNVDYTKETSIEITETLRVADYEPDDVESESSIEEYIQEFAEKKVVIDSQPDFYHDSDDEVDEQIQSLDDEKKNL